MQQIKHVGYNLKFQAIAVFFVKDFYIFFKNIAIKKFSNFLYLQMPIIVAN